jgi:hypothetical protein
MDRRLKAATSVMQCVGAITSNPSVVQDFFTAGLPVWFIQPLVPGPFPYNVLHVVTAFEPADFVCIDNAIPPFSVVYDGPLNNVEKHKAMHRFSRNWLAFKDPLSMRIFVLLGFTGSVFIRAIPVVRWVGCRCLFHVDL